MFVFSKDDSFCHRFCGQHGKFGSSQQGLWQRSQCQPHAGFPLVCDCSMWFAPAFQVGSIQSQCEWLCQSAWPDRHHRSWMEHFRCEVWWTLWRSDSMCRWPAICMQHCSGWRTAMGCSCSAMPDLVLWWERGARDGYQSGTSWLTAQTDLASKPLEKTECEQQQMHESAQLGTCYVCTTCAWEHVTCKLMCIFQIKRFLVEILAHPATTLFALNFQRRTVFDSHTGVPKWHLLVDCSDWFGIQTSWENGVWAAADARVCTAWNMLWTLWPVWADLQDWNVLLFPFFRHLLSYGQQNSKFKPLATFSCGNALKPYR